MHSRDICFQFYFNMKDCCVFSLESPYLSDSNEYTQHTLINMKKTITRNYPKYNYVCSYKIVLVRDTRTSLK